MQISTSAAALATTLLLASATAAYSIPPSNDNELHIRNTFDDEELYVRDPSDDEILSIRDLLDDEEIYIRDLLDDNRLYIRAPRKGDMGGFLKDVGGAMANAAFDTARTDPQSTGKELKGVAQDKSRTAKKVIDKHGKKIDGAGRVAGKLMEY